MVTKSRSKSSYKRARSKSRIEKKNTPFFIRFFTNFFRGMGFGLVFLALFVFGVIVGPAIKQEVGYLFQSFLQTREAQEVYAENLSEASRTDAIQKEALDYGVDSHFSIVVPKINAKANILANVNSSNPLDYKKALKQGVAHAAGTYFPGQGKNIYLFAHSTDFDFNVSSTNAVFYLLNKLEAGDKIVVYFSDDRFVYEVKELHSVRATDTGWLTQTLDEEVLYLQTCDPPGTTWRRLIVVAKPIV